ncbi:unnamed protein product [Discula destructiva]
MADEVPLALKQADINLYKTATRAAQLQTVKPIIAYWCEYWVVNQILARNIHNDSADVLDYTTMLMDKLEQTKNEYASEDAIVDDAAAQAYLEQFAQETLDRAEKVIKANKVTLQTASTFDAALTFLNLVNIWGPPDTETQQKIKYAKWNAARITRAIKEGKDPNESNPKQEDLPPAQPALDPNDPEVQELGSPSHAPRPATVEDAPDPDLAQHFSAAPTVPQFSDPPEVPPADDGELQLPSAPGYGDEAVSPAQPSGYFDPPPELPSPISPPSHHSANDMPDTSAPPTAPAWSPTPPPAASGFPPPSGPSAPPATFSPAYSPAPGPVSPPSTQNFSSVPPPASVSRPVVPAPTSRVASVAASGNSQVPEPQVSLSFAADDQAMSLAQKHARWAISALNFEDVPTAVRELRRALETLGAT